MAKKINGLPVYEIALGDGDVGVFATSIVANPAIKSNFLHFNEDKEHTQFKFATNPLVEAEIIESQLDTKSDLQELIGAIMIPDMPIYRNTGDQGFFVNFRPQVIREIVSKMLTEGYAGMFTVEHSTNPSNGDVQLMELWIKDSDTDKSTEFGFQDMPIGTAFMRAKINNPTLWSEIKENGLNGFSVELDASIVESFSAIEEEDKKEDEVIKDDVINMIEKMFNSHIEVNGAKLYFNDELKEGTPVFQDVEGVPTAYTGEIVHEDNKIVVDNGRVDSVENIQVSTDEKISGLSAEFKSVVEKLTDVFSMKKSLEEKEADLTLREKQLAGKTEEFSNNDDKKELSIKQRRLKFAEESNNWFNQFKGDK